MMSTEIFSESALESLKGQFDTEKDWHFFNRVWNSDPGIYTDRLKAIGFAEAGTVLDAGCGYGQWTFQLAQLNQQVRAFDFAEDRVRVCKAVHELAFPHIEDLEFTTGDLAAIPAEDAAFDAAFCYSSIYQADFIRAFHELHRVLKPGGRLYFSTNDLGWYIYNILEQHNPSADFSPRDYAIETILHSLQYFHSGQREQGKSIVMPLEIAVTELEGVGFDVVDSGADGSISTGTDEPVRSFYDETAYGIRNVYEVLCVKR